MMAVRTHQLFLTAGPDNYGYELFGLITVPPWRALQHAPKEKVRRR